jgi:drug/metabolite transporter (DMT)-like permease
MTSLSIILVVIASVLHVSRDFMTKKVHDKQVFIWWFSWISLLALAPFAIFLMVKNPIHGETWLWAAGAGLVHSSYWVAYSKAYESKDFSQVYPIIRSSPLLVLLFAILIFHEQITALGLVGILTISLGVYFITKHPPEKIAKKEGLGFAFTMSIFANLYSTLDPPGPATLF